MPGNVWPRERQFAHEVQPAAVRQTQVAEQQVKCVLSHCGQSRLDTVYAVDFVTRSAQQALRVPGGVSVVLDQKYCAVGQRAAVWRPCPPAARLQPRRRSYGPAADTGLPASSTVNVAPWPSPALRAEMAPPCISTTALQMLSPSPRPPKARASRACSKALKRRGSMSGAMPLPVSVTSMTRLRWGGRRVAGGGVSGQSALFDRADAVRRDERAVLRGN